MGLPKTQFAVWLRTQIFGKEEKCRKIIIRHGTPTARIGQVLFSIDVPEQRPEEANWDEWVNEQVDLIENLTQADAEGSNIGNEKYVIQVYHSDSNVPSANFSVRMRGTTNIDDDGIESEPATKSGLLAQLMRHNEALMRMAILGNHDTMKSLTSNMARQESVIEKLLDEKFENITVIDAMISKKHEREIESTKAAHDMEMKEALFEKALLLAPVIANKLLGKGNNGKKLLPEETSAIEQEIQSLSASLTDKQLEDMQKILEPAQSLTFFDILKSVNEKTGQLLQKKNEEPEK